MYSTIILLVFFAFLLFYNLSKKSKWDGKPEWAKKMSAKKVLSKSISAALMCTACILLTIQSGTGAGIFAFIVILMAVGCMIVLFTPFRYLATKHIAVIYLVFLVFEIFIF